ncbi:MAG: hypothetical protein ACYTFQ_12315 [Planctomycetota bacterium]|jgi:hypothetical protein
MLGGVLGFLTKLGSPVVVAIVGKVVREIFKAEFSFGKGHGALKLVQVVNYIKAAIKGEHEINVDEDEIVKIVEKTVGILNAIGLLDDKPGTNVDLGKLLAAIGGVVEAVAELVED